MAVRGARQPCGHIGARPPLRLVQVSLISLICVGSCSHSIAGGEVLTECDIHAEEVEQDSAALLQNLLSRRAIGVDAAVTQAAPSATLADEHVALDPQVWADWTNTLFDHVLPRRKESDLDSAARKQVHHTSLLDNRAVFRKFKYQAHWPKLQLWSLMPIFAVAFVFMICSFATYKACTVPIFERRKKKTRFCSQTLGQPQNLEARVAAAKGDLAGASSDPQLLPSARSLKAARPSVDGYAYSLFAPSPNGPMSPTAVGSKADLFMPASFRPAVSQRSFTPSLPPASFRPAVSQRSFAPSLPPASPFAASPFAAAR